MNAKKHYEYTIQFHRNDRPNDLTWTSETLRNWTKEKMKGRESSDKKPFL